MIKRKNRKNSFRGPNYPRSDFGVDIQRECPAVPMIFFFSFMFTFL